MTFVNWCKIGSFFVDSNIFLLYTNIITSSRKYPRDDLRFVVLGRALSLSLSISIAIQQCSTPVQCFVCGSVQAHFPSKKQHRNIKANMRELPENLDWRKSIVPGMRGQYYVTEVKILKSSIVHLLYLLFHFFDVVFTRFDLFLQLFNFVIQNKLEFLQFLVLLLQIVNSFFLEKKKKKQSKKELLGRSKSRRLWMR